MSALAEVFRPAGTLARALEGFVARPSQLRMAERIARALEERERLLIEAGTGTGKTFAYLVPALTSGLRVLISTGTRTLQDQLYSRDIPLLAGALGRPLTTALLKGRANYLCRLKLGGGAAQAALFGDEEQALLGEIRDWAARTQSGDLAEVAALGESHPLRAQLTSTRESCTGQQCPEFSRCHVFAARRAALEAELVVVNHHLLLADLALKEDGFGELLPGVDAMILDEAHQLPDLAAECFGLSCSSRQVETLLLDARREQLLLGLNPAELAAAHARLEQALKRLAAGLGRQERRVAWEELDAPSRQACAELGVALGSWASELEARTDAPGVTQCAARALALVADMEGVMAEPDAADAGGARSIGVSARGFTLSLLPYDISARFRSLVDQHPSAWVFTSATLALAGNFEHFSKRLGLGDAATLCLDSPFDYERQALLYFPPGLPDPGAANYTEAVLEAVRPLLDASDGGAFLLFTSHRSLRAAARILRASDWPASWPLLVQNDAPRELLLRRFRDSGRAVLLGTASFWEGVDVQGVALRLVVIDKLPFAPPDDPLVRARVQHLTSLGLNAFRDYQLPEAALALKQGVGRLIRSEEDRGVVMICDPRLFSRGYGRTLLAVLPPMRPTREAEEAIGMLSRCAREVALA
jgi:ATP-dependent DNA helicase DinG